MVLQCSNAQDIAVNTGNGLAVFRGAADGLMYVKDTNGTTELLFSASSTVLNTSGNNGTGEIDLSTQVLNIIGATGQISTSVSGSNITISLTATSDAITQGAVNLYNQTHTGEVTGSGALTIANEVITAAKLSPSLTSDAIPQGGTNLYNQTHTGEVTGSGALTIASDVVGYTKIAPEFKSYYNMGLVTGGVYTNWALHNSFKFTLGGSITLTIQNQTKGSVKTYVISGSGGGSSIYLECYQSISPKFLVTNGAYDDTATWNFIQIECVEDTRNEEIFFVSISQGTESPLI